MDIKMTADPGKERISPLGFLLYAREFFQLAKAIPRQEDFSPVPYYLVCRSLELGLKAFALAKGDTVKDIKDDLGRDLTKALKRASELGLAAFIQISPEEESEIAKANAYYDRKGFEYFEVRSAVTGYPNLPSLEILENVASRLLSALKPVCESC